MAIVNWTAGSLNDGHKAGQQVITWVLANGDTGQPFRPSNLRDSVGQIFGTFGTGGSVTMQGSNDPRVITDPSNAVWVTVQDSLGNAWTKTSAGGDNLLENYIYFRPHCTAGDGTTALTIVVKFEGNY